MQSSYLSIVVVVNVRVNKIMWAGIKQHVHIHVHFPQYIDSPFLLPYNNERNSDQSFFLSIFFEFWIFHIITWWWWWWWIKVKKNGRRKVRCRQYIYFSLKFFSNFCFFCFSIPNVNKNSQKKYKLSEWIELRRRTTKRVQDFLSNESSIIMNYKHT